MDSGLFSEKGGYEYVMVLAAVAVLFAPTGAGRYSLDAVLWSRHGEDAGRDRESVHA